MGSINKVILVGRLTADPEVRSTASGSSVANLRVATSDSWTDKNTGQKQESSEFHRVTFFGKLADVCGKYLGKGSQIYIEGSLKTSKWQDKEGNDRYTTQINGYGMQMLGEGRGKDTQPAPQSPPRQPVQQSSFGEEEISDDIPFS